MIFRRRLLLTALAAFLVSATIAKEGSTSAFSLNDAKAYAIENSYMAKNAVRDVEIAKRKIKETAAIGLPQVNGTVDFQNFIEIPTSLVPSNAFNPAAPADEFTALQFGTDYNITAGLSVSQLIFDGSYIVALQATRTYLELSKNAKEKTEIEIASGITSTYGMVLIAEKNLTILEGNITNLDKMLSDTKALYENGFAEEQDVEQLRFSLGNLKNTQNATKKQIEVAYNLLKFQMGIPIEDEITLTDNLEILLGAAAFGEGLGQEVNVENHIDYKMSLTSLVNQELMLKNSKAGFLPSLSGFFNYQSSYLGNDLDFANNSWYPTSLWGLSLKVPIFSSLMKHQQVQQSKLELEKTQNNLELTKYNLTVEAMNAQIEYTNNVNAMNLQKENVRLADKIAKNTEIKFVEGMASSLELTQAQTQQLSAQGGYISAMFNVINAKTKLEKALGTK
jgi:outer membrane protein|tara:strand:+ start:985 stop:2334 length:1350 start_codon:yes stop_codon:yes gene_type:complete